VVYVFQYLAPFPNTPYGRRYAYRSVWLDRHEWSNYGKLIKLTTKDMDHTTSNHEIKLNAETKPTPFA
jgi:hypothetical protein